MVKAGSAGSNPDGATKQTKPVSHPLSVLLNDIGDAVSNLNAIVVGLDALENGYEKPESLDISFDPHDKKFAARKARKFAVEAVIVRVSEAVIEYIGALSRLPRLAGVSAKWNGDTKNAVKVSDVLKEFLGADYLIPAAVLLVHWRNRIVHRGSNAKLDPKEKAALQTNEAEIAKNYKNLSVDCLLCHFEEGRPSLKDASSMISMCINLARKIDEALHTNLTKDDLDAWLDHYELLPKIERVKAETKPDKVEASIRRLFQAEAPRLYEEYLKHQTAAR